MSDPYGYDYQVDGTAIVDTVNGPCSYAILEEGASGKRAELVDIAYQHGVYVAERHWSQARLMNFRTGFKNGTPAEIYEYKENLTYLMYGGLRTLTRTDPHVGDVQASVIVTEEVRQPSGPDRFDWVWPVWLLSGYWEDATPAVDNDDTGLGASDDLTQFVLTGSHATEPVFTIDCTADGSNPAIVDPATGDQILAADSFTAGDTILIDVPDRRAYLNGTRVKNMITINRGHWMEFTARATVDLDFTSDSGTWDVNTSVRNRYRA